MQLIHGNTTDAINYAWKHHNNKQAANVTLYTDGLLEYQGKLDVNVENIGTASEQVVINNLIITIDKDGNTVIVTL
ncbi:MAG: hypothetical protein WDA42_00580 [Candidatus Bathyarchaeia archaeon]|jgi:hypothetical protein